MSSDWKELTAEWQADFQFLGKNDRDALVQMGTIPNSVSPMEMLLLGVAGCTGIDVVSILQKQRQELVDFQVKIRGKRADEHPKVYTHIEIEYLLWGKNLSEKAIVKAIELSEEKYCSASAMMSKTAEIKSSYRIFESEK